MQKLACQFASYPFHSEELCNISLDTEDKEKYVRLLNMVNLVTTTFTVISDTFDVSEKTPASKTYHNSTECKNIVA